MSFPCVLARGDLAKRSVPRDSTVRQEKRFFPSSTLDRFLDETAIESILNCACDQCKGHLADLGKQDPPIKYAPQILGTNGPTDAKALFALLIFIEHPMFIVAFMERGMNSKSLENFCAQPQFEPKTLEDYWPRYRKRNPGDSLDLAEKFSFSMHQFVPPIFDHGNFSLYSANTILPIIEGARLGSGSYGDVYPFTIQEGYNQIPVRFSSTRPVVCKSYLSDSIQGAETIKHFARKELKHKNPAMEFALEKASLSTVECLKDDHIVRYVQLSGRPAAAATVPLTRNSGSSRRTGSASDTTSYFPVRKPISSIASTTRP